MIVFLACCFACMCVCAKRRQRAWLRRHGILFGAILPLNTQFTSSTMHKPYARLIWTGAYIRNSLSLDVAFFCSLNSIYHKNDKLNVSFSSVCVQTRSSDYFSSCLNDDGGRTHRKGKKATQTWEKNRRENEAKEEMLNRTRSYTLYSHRSLSWLMTQIHSN